MLWLGGEHWERVREHLPENNIPPNGNCSTHTANHYEVTLVQLSFEINMIEAKPANLIGDRAYDSYKLDEELRHNGIEMIAPHRSNRVKPKTQDDRRLRCYQRL